MMYSPKKIVSIHMLYAELENVHNIERCLADMSHIAMLSKTEALNDEDRNDVKENLEYILGYARALEMNDITHLISGIFMPRIEDKTTNFTQDCANNIRERIVDSLLGVLSAYGCILLSPKEAIQFKGKGKDWEPVISKWGSLSYDIKEAGKCLAVGKSTAAVFHLMRILENSVQLLLKDLSVTQYKNKAIEDCVMNETLQALGNKRT